MRKKGLILGMIFLVGVGVYAVRFFQSNVTVKTSIASKGTMTFEMKCAGTINFLNEYPIFMQRAGKVKNIYVEDGMLIKQGQILLELDKRDYLVQKAAAEGALYSARNTLSKTINGARDQEIAQVEANLRLSKANYERAITKADRYCKLYETGAISKEQYDDILVQKEVQRQTLEAQQQSLSLIKEGATSEDRAIISGQLQQAEASYENSINTLDYTVVRSPIDGIIFAKDIKEGEMISVDKQLMSIGNINNIIMEAEVEEQYLFALKVDDELKITSPSFRGHEYIGKIATISPVAMYSPVKSKRAKYIVKLLVQSPDQYIKPGMNAEIRMALKNDNLLLIPRDCLLKNTSTEQVFVVEDGNVRLVNVSIGFDNGSEVEILSGLSDGQRVVSQPRGDLVDNTAVKFY